MPYSLYSVQFGFLNLFLYTEGGSFSNDGEGWLSKGKENVTRHHYIAIFI